MAGCISFNQVLLASTGLLRALVSQNARARACAYSFFSSQYHLIAPYLSHTCANLIAPCMHLVLCAPNHLLVCPSALLAGSIILAVYTIGCRMTTVRIGRHAVLGKHSFGLLKRSATTPVRPSSSFFFHQPNCRVHFVCITVDIHDL